MIAWYSPLNLTTILAPKAIIHKYLQLKTSGFKHHTLALPLLKLNFWECKDCYARIVKRVGLLMLCSLDLCRGTFGDYSIRNMTFFIEPLEEKVSLSACERWHGLHNAIVTVWLIATISRQSQHLLSQLLLLIYVYCRCIVNDCMHEVTYV